MSVNKNVRLVLSSGGARGLAHIGAIKALEDHGFHIKSISGSSIGAVIGGLYAMGKLDDYTKWISTLDKTDVWGLMDFALTGKGLLKGEKVFDRMKTFIPDVNIEDMAIPFVAVATDILHGKEVLFDKGSFYNAARASVAIPALITPVHFNETILVDGGVINPIPFDFVKPVDNTGLVAINLYGSVLDEHYCSSQTPISKDSDQIIKTGLFNTLTKIISSSDKINMGYFTLLTAVSSAMLSRIAQLSIEIHQPDLVIHIPGDSAGTFEFFRAEELIELGRTIGEEAILAYFNHGK